MGKTIRKPIRNPPKLGGLYSLTINGPKLIREKIYA